MKNLTLHYSRLFQSGIVSLWVFFCGMVLKTKETGAIAPSSPWLAEEMLAGLDFSTDKTILELGPGNGIFTEHILEHMSDHSTLLCVELNYDFCLFLEKKFAPEITKKRLILLHGSAIDLVHLFEQHHCDRVDLVISGLPWTLFPLQVQEEILYAVKAVMKPSAIFRTFNYSLVYFLKPARAFRSNITKILGPHSISGSTLRNIPPARVIEARKEEMEF